MPFTYTPPPADKHSVIHYADPKKCDKCLTKHSIYGKHCSVCTQSSTDIQPQTTNQNHSHKLTHDKSIEPPVSGDCSPDILNLSNELLAACGRRILQQRRFDRKPLGVGVCYGCGHILWTSVDGAHTFLINKPDGKKDTDAPASAYLASMPNNTLTFFTPREVNQQSRDGIPAHIAKAIPSPQNNTLVIFSMIQTAQKSNLLHNGT